MTPAILYDPLFLEHDTGPQHPENATRLLAVTERLRRRGVWDRLRRIAPEPAPEEDLKAVHDPGYLERLRAACRRGGGWLTADTPFGAHSCDAAALAAGAAIRAVDAVLDGEAPSAMALVRPPGHHAGADFGMGFCLINHAAVAARYAVRRRGLRRVMIVDFDVHHGNGTQEIFYEDPSVLFFSAHQYPAYPGTGAASETGRGAGLGTTVNVPLPVGVGDEGYGKAFRCLLVPIARRFRPELLLVSAGYDAHWTNTAYLNSIRMAVTVNGFADWVGLLKSLADDLCGGRLALTLEGGYDPDALAASVEATLRVLMDEPVDDPIGPPPPGWGPPEPRIDAVLEECRRIHGLP